MENLEWRLGDDGRGRFFARGAIEFCGKMEKGVWGVSMSGVVLLGYGVACFSYFGGGGFGGLCVFAELFDGCGFA